MMRIQYASDLHLEFTENSSYLKNNPLDIVGDILILAGDIGYIGDDNYSKHSFWDWASENYKEVIIIPGNHEFYKMFDLNNLYNGWMLEIRKNVRCYYNAVIPLRKDIELVATTLWAHISFRDAFRTESTISDFHRIRSGGNQIDFNRFNKEHYRCFNFLKDVIAKSKAKHVIVATHHVPSFELMAPEYKGNPLNGAFTVELGDYIVESGIEYWIYGHSHRNIDKVIGNTKCISNQLGYVFRKEHTSFDASKHIEIE